MNLLKILYHDEDLVVIDKPAGFWVHPPEDLRTRYSSSQNCLGLLKHQIGKYIYPVHRLDRATSGVVIYALNKESASELGKQFMQNEIQKKYYAVVRGEPSRFQKIDYLLKNESGSERPSSTEIETLHTVELPFPNKRFQSSRFSIIQAFPKTGAYHQIRRHLKHLRHPLIGDTIYGDGAQNKIFSEQLQIKNLLLRAYQISFKHPRLNTPLTIQSSWNHLWHCVFDVFGLCPYDRKL